MLAAEGNARVVSPESLNSADPDDEKSGAARRSLLLFKSLSVLSRDVNSSEKVASESGLSIIEDLIDVLVVVQLSDVSIMDLPREQLRPYAERLALSVSHVSSSTILRQDFLGLLKLLLSIAMNEPSMDTKFQTARLLTNLDPALLTGSSDALLARFTRSEQNDVEWEAFEDIVTTYLVNPYIQAKHNIWLAH